MFCRVFLGPGYGQFGSNGGVGMFLMMGIGFLIVLTLILLAFKLMKNNSHSNLLSNNSTLSSNSALNILNDRYAKGEIDEEEYSKRKIILNQKN